MNDEFGDVFGTILTLTGEGYSYAELEDISDQVRNVLLTIPEVAKVEVQGVQEERIFVEYNNARLADLGLSAYQLMNLLESRNIVLPGGAINTRMERIALEPSGSFESIEDLGRTIINVSGRTEMIYLEDIASIYRDYVDPPQQRVRSSGKPALALAISLREGGNLIQLGKEVEAKVRHLQDLYPIGLEFDTIAFQPQVVEQKVDAFISNLVQAVAIVMLVMLVTLGLRTGLVVSSLIPSTIVMSLLVMSFLGIGLDQMSLAALIIALGLLVDNAIVVSESIMVRMSTGMKRIEAAVESANELRVPLLTSSLTTAAAFLPIYLAESATGEYTAPLFKVVSIALLCSWLLSLTLIPMLCVFFLKVEHVPEEERLKFRLYVWYRNVLLFSLRHRILSLLCVVLIFGLSLQGFGLIPNVFFPPKDQAMFTAEFDLPIGTPIERTEAFVQRVEGFIETELKTGPERPQGVINWASFIGQGPQRYTLTYTPKQRSPEYAMMLLNTTSYGIIHDLIPRLETYCLESFPDVKPTIRSLLNGPPVEDPIEIRISGEDVDQVFAIVDQVKMQLAAIQGAKNISDNWGARTKKLVVRIDQPRARRAGLNSQDVAVSLQTVLSGFETTDYREDDKIIPITLRSVAADRQDIGKLESLNIFSQLTGSAVPLKQVADIEVTWEPAKYLRRDRLATVTVSAALKPDFTAVEIINQLDPWLRKEKTDWPVGFDYAYGGEIEASVKANTSVMAKVPIGALIIVLLLVGQFNSIRRPLIILTTIPLGLIGVIFGLLIAKSHFGFMTFLGVISLSGIVINNAIVLLDRIKVEIERNGLDPARAVIESAQRRLRPILLTTFTTIGGMIPLWMGGGPMYEPMAIAIIFGLLFATLLTLGVVPIFYSVLFGVRFKEFRY